MAGQRPLEPLIKVRILAPEPRSRELRAGPAEPRTAPWMHAKPGDGSIEAPPETKSDPWLVPVVVFVRVLLACIGVFLYEETHKGLPGSLLANSF